MRRCVLLFTKPATAGRVKTRLIGELSSEQAARLHEAFLTDVVESLSGGEFTLEVRWAVEDGGGNALPDLGLPAGIQAGGDLGERLFTALAEAGERFDAVAAVGSDHPEIDRASLEEAFSLLEGGRTAVLGPARDGGYYLIALRSAQVRPAWFEDIPWSTSETLAVTVERFRSAGIEPALLPLGDDVDTPADLSALAIRLAARAGRCAHTRALLTEWGRLP